MKRFALLLMFTTLFVGSSHASSSQVTILCPLYYAKRLKEKLPAKANDKYKHCTLSCQMALRCSAIDTMNLGILKEVWDLVSPGNAEWADLKADAQGIEFAIKKQAINDKECSQQCNDIYWSN